MSGPWVVLRRDGQLLEFLDVFDHWTSFLEDANRMASEHVARHMAAELEDEGRGQTEAVPLDEARKLVGGVRHG